MSLPNRTRDRFREHDVYQRWITMNFLDNLWAQYGMPPRPIDVVVGEYRAKYFPKWSGNKNSPMLHIDVNNVEVRIYTSTLPSGSSKIMPQ